MATPSDLAQRRAAKALEAHRKAAEQEVASEQAELAKTEQAFARLVEARAAYARMLDQRANTQQQEQRKIDQALKRFQEARDAELAAVTAGASPARMQVLTARTDKAQESLTNTQTLADYRNKQSERGVAKSERRADSAVAEHRDAQTEAQAKAQKAATETAGTFQTAVVAEQAYQDAIANAAKAAKDAALQKQIDASWDAEAAKRAEMFLEAQKNREDYLVFKKEKAAEEIKRISDAQEAAILIAMKNIEDAEEAAASLAKQRADAEKEMVATQLSLDKERIASFDATTRAMKATLGASAGLSDNIRGIGTAFSQLLRGNVVGAIQTGASFLQRNAAAMIGGRDQQSADVAQGIGKRERALSAGDVAGALPSALPWKGPAPAVAMEATARPIVSAAAGGAGKPPIPGITAAAGGAEGGAAAAAGAEGAGLVGAAAIAGPAAAAVAAIAMVGKAMLDLAGKASPAQMERFQLALDDTQAVIGRMFVPVLELATDGVRMIGDTLASILPSADEMRTALLPFKDAFKDLGDTLAPLLPVLKGMISGFVTLSGWLLKIQVWITTFPIMLAKALGLIDEGGGAAMKGKSLGASQQPASFMDISGYLKQSYEKAASMGAEGKGASLDSVSEILQAFFKIAGEWFRNPFVSILGPRDKNDQSKSQDVWGDIAGFLGMGPVNGGGR